MRGVDDWVMLSEFDRIVQSNALRHGIMLDQPSRITEGLKALQLALARGEVRPGEVKNRNSAF